MKKHTDRAAKNGSGSSVLEYGLIAVLTGAVFIAVLTVLSNGGNQAFGVGP